MKLQALLEMLLSGVSWVMLFVWGGYLFGNIPVVKQNFGIVTIVIIFVSLIPLVVTLTSFSS